MKKETASFHAIEALDMVEFRGVWGRFWATLGDFGRLWATLDDIEASEMVDFRVWCRRSGRRDAVGGTSGGQVGTIGVKMQDLLSDGDVNKCETCNL